MTSLSINKKKLLLAETLLFLQEQQPIAPTPQQNPPVASQQQSAPPQSSPLPTAANPTQPQQEPAMASQPATIEAIVDALNQIRAGSSFSEPEIYRKVSDFWDGMQETEKSGTLKALEGIAGIVTVDNGQQPLEQQQNSPQQTPPGGNSTPPPAAKTGMPPASNPAVNGAMNAPVAGQPVGM